MYAAPATARGGSAQVAALNAEIEAFFGDAPRTGGAREPPASAANAAGASMSALSELSPDGMATFATGGLEASAGAAAADGLRVQAPSRGAVDGRGGLDDMSRAPGSLTHVDGTG